jgi:hypothetical protein
MIFRITMKDPDGVSDCIQDAATEAVRSIDSLDDDERDDMIEVRKDKLGKVCGKWFEYGEYLTVEVDTEKGTCTVVEV